MVTAEADLRYPIGRVVRRKQVPADERPAMIETIALMPKRLAAAVTGLNAAQLDTPYRPGGWTVRQTVHHLADSHMNSFVRFKLAVTENAPTIKPYDEALWAETADARTVPIELSMTLLEGLHARWVMLLRSFGEGEWARTVMHPEIGPVTLDELLCIYEWHSRHHVAHITSLREREGF